jgi:twitching motility two-component system response regulator PilH
MLSTTLEDHGYEVEIATTAPDGLERARLLKPHAILMDVVFQGMSGFQCTRKLARDPETAHIPIIIISGKNQESDRVWGLRQGAAEYLTKPVKPKTLIQALDGLIGDHASAG